ncbi:polysaccharide ABC transporter ATP-binding protein [Alkalimarinus coralli]|uniref:ABC transporter ATP-binding protein n=1 Tax=Alkalimarinus coralli TaxID=2935863 RepID=UPI00202B4AA1|nr:polysaccharide ABC transporter ATP-binding protein [Alkalimarinus coralli]
MIRVNNISKVYFVWKTPLSRLLVPLAKRFLSAIFPDWYQRFENNRCQQVNALENVSFEIERGGSLGIIGLNGSGKSTLLQIIAGTLPATSGSVDVTGRVAALLELGSGFDLEFTGHENVYLNASILGLSRADIDTRYEDIVAFADIGDFIHRPVKTYSSGMMVRLAFAVQVHVDPEVLIVDEALAVGDARFQAKALTKIEEILGKGTTLLFVGHDLNTVRAFCKQAMLLDKGRVVQYGFPDDVTMTYLQNVQREGIEKQREKMPSIENGKGFAIDGWGITQAHLEGHGHHASLQYDEAVTVCLTVTLGHLIDSPYLILDLVDAKGLQLTGKRIPIPPGEKSSDLKVTIKCAFQKGIYRFRMRLVDAPGLDRTRLISRQDDLLSLEVIEDVRHLFTGLFPVPLTYEWLERPNNG